MVRYQIIIRKESEGIWDTFSYFYRESGRGRSGKSCEIRSEGRGVQEIPHMEGNGIGVQTFNDLAEKLGKIARTIKLDFRF